MMIVTLQSLALWVCLAMTASAAPQPAPTTAPAPTCSFVPTFPPQPKVQCNVRGTLSKPVALGVPRQFASPDLCRNTCFKKYGCISFSYNTQTKYCQFYSDFIIKMGFTQSTTGDVLYFNRRCFKKRCEGVPVPPTCSNSGYEYAIFSNDQGANGQCDVGDTTCFCTSQGCYPHFDPTLFKTLTPEATGRLGYISGFQWQTVDPVTVYDNSYSFYPNYTAIAHRGYFYPQVAGTYTINVTSVDDIAEFWIGDYAYSGWTRNNTIGEVAYVPHQAVFKFSMPTTGTYYPFRVLYANGQGYGDFYMTIKDPQGDIFFDKGTGLSTDIVSNGCSNTQAPAYPAWGSET